MADGQMRCSTPVEVPTSPQPYDILSLRSALTTTIPIDVSVTTFEHNVSNGSTSKKSIRSDIIPSKTPNLPNKVLSDARGDFADEQQDGHQASLSSPNNFDKDQTRADHTLDVGLVNRGSSVPGSLSDEQNNDLWQEKSSDASYDDADSRVDVELQAKNIRARERVEILRGRVWRTRQITNGSRQRAQELRNAFSTATSLLMKAIDTLMASDDVKSLQTLKPFHEATRSAQDALGPEEDRLDMLEIRLNSEESELEQEEMHFYTHNKISLEPPATSKLDAELSPLHKPYRPENEEFEFVDLDNDLAKQYFAQREEAELLKEEIDELEARDSKVREEQQFRMRHNLELSREDASFLFDFPKLQAQLYDKLKSVEHDVLELREQCLDIGLFSEDEHTYEQRDTLVEDVMESVNEALDRLPVYIALQQQDSSIKSHDTDYSDKRDYVNAWILASLQDSLFEEYRLKAEILYAYPPHGKGLTGDEWSELAVTFWTTDEAGERANILYELSTRDAISELSNSKSSLQINLGEGFGVIEGSSETISELDSEVTQRDDQVVAFFEAAGV